MTKVGRGGGVGSTLVLAVLLVVVSVAAGVGIAYLLMKPPPPPPPPPLGIQRLNQLATAKQTIQVVVTEKQNAHILRKPLPEFLTGERVLLVAVGNVEAGINMDEVDKEDVHVVGKKVTIDLPDAKILSSSLDEDKTRLYDRDRGLLKIRGNDALLDKARRDAEDRIVEIAKENGIVEQAQNNAKDSIRTLMLNSGYKKVVFVWGEGFTGRAAIGYDHGYDGEVFYLSLALDPAYVEGCLERIGEDAPEEERHFRDLWDDETHREEVVESLKADCEVMTGR